MTPARKEPKPIPGRRPQRTLGCLLLDGPRLDLLHRLSQICRCRRAVWFPVAEARPPTQVSCVRLPGEQKKVQCLDPLCHMWCFPAIVGLSFYSAVSHKTTVWFQRCCRSSFLFLISYLIYLEVVVLGMRVIKAASHDS